MKMSPRKFLVSPASLLLVIHLMIQSEMVKATFIKNLQKRDGKPSNEGPAAKCQDIYDANKESPSGYYDIQMGSQMFKVYCYFHNPQSTVIRQFNDIDGKPQEWNVYEHVGVDDGDPEGAMEMQFEEHEIPVGAGPHFTQPIIDEQEKMYWNKTMTIQSLIDTNNERKRKKEKEKQKQQKGI